MIALALGLILLAAFLVGAAALPRGVRDQRKSRAPAGRRAPRAVGARARHRARRVLRLRRTTPGGDASSAALPGRASHACGTRTSRVDSRACPCRAPTTPFALGADARDCAPTASAGGARAGSRHADAAPRVAEPSAPRAGTAAGLFAAARRSRTPLICSPTGARPGPSMTTTRCAISRCAPTTSPTIRWSGPGWPALRVKALTESRGAAQFRDEEILPGVEDLQVEFGVARAARRRRACTTSRRTRRGARRHASSPCGCGCGFAPTPPSRVSTTTATLALRRTSRSRHRQPKRGSAACWSSAPSRCAMRGRHEDPRSAAPRWSSGSCCSRWSRC